jgi:hypothetical protein
MLSKPQVWLSNISLPQCGFAAYLAIPRHSVQAEEDTVMLKEFNHIARQMLFLHGHLVRPSDWAENDVRESRPSKGSTSKQRALRLAAACLSCGIVTPARFVSGQIR